MKQEVKTLDDKILDISIEEFDILNNKYIFSKEYQKRKRKMWKEYPKMVYATMVAVIIDKEQICDYNDCSS